MIIQLSPDIIFKDIVVTPDLSFFKLVVERCFDFFKANGYPDLVSPYKWEDRIAHVDTGIYLEAGKTINLTDTWNIDCDFILRYPLYEAGYVYPHKLIVENLTDKIYFKLVFNHGDEVKTEFWAEINMPPELESRFISCIEEK